MSTPNNYGIVSLLDYFSALQSMRDNGQFILSKYISVRIELEFETDISAYYVACTDAAHPNANYPNNTQLTF